MILHQDFWLKNDPLTLTTFSWIDRDWHETWLGLIDHYVINRKTVVQAGGWQGVYPKRLSRIFEQVITFEPDPENFDCLAKNCQENSIIKIQAGLDCNPGLKIFEQTEWSGQNRFQQTKAWDMPLIDKLQALTLTLDSLALTNCDLLWLDVENLELNALLGAEQTILKNKPVIIWELGFKLDQNSTIDHMLQSWNYNQEWNDGKDCLYIPKNPART